MNERFDTGSDELNQALDDLAAHLQTRGYVTVHPRVHRVLAAAGRCPFRAEPDAPWAGNESIGRRTEDQE